MNTERREAASRIRADKPLQLNPKLVDALAGKELGLHRGEVRLANHSPQWEQAFTQLQQILHGDMPAGVKAIEHIGSTAVPGLKTKPILDIIIGTVPEANSEELHCWLLEHGFIYRGEAGNLRPDTMYGFEIQTNIRLINVHLIAYGQTEWSYYLNFRNHLRANPEDRAAYQQLKERLAARQLQDRRGYLDGKAKFIIQRRKA
ncbi:GrpB family protein [Glutamicibacter sp. FBE19]|uniref:GrpB family protein n=1 Tax=Glutamicibacter sp. FBE19 TaxID=2761534 RepID=UPI0018964735|nr:GrpB family protein [Glutamicibacter sp. FBE19]MBF6673470.1 GrpB family protein [Glutamicibacter sp. FBE19]